MGGLDGLDGLGWISGLIILAIKGDPVYLAREDQLAEYLLNDTGKIFIGTHRYPLLFNPI